MARVAFFNVPAHGHVNPTVRVVEGLVEKGEEVVYHVAPGFHGKLVDTGACCVAGDPPVDVDPENPDPNLVRLGAMLLEASLVLMDRFDAEFAHERFDYVIHDSMCPWGRFFAQKRGLPAICSTSTFAFDWSVALSGGMSGDLASMLPGAARAVARYARIAWELVEKHGVWGLCVMDMFTNVEDLTLVYTSRLLQPRGAGFDTRYRFVGPSLPAQVETLGFPLSRLHDRPVVYVALGTLVTDRVDFYRACIEAFADSDVTVVMSIGRKTDPAELGSIPESFIVRPFVPQVAVLDHASVFVTHGGMNSVHEGLLAGVPLVLVPQTAEQALVARRVRELGAGRVLTRGSVKSGEIRTACVEMMGSAGAADAVSSLRTSLVGAGGPDRAVEEILRHARIKGIV